VNSWPAASLGEIFDIARGGSPRPIDQFITEDPDGINWITIGDASEGQKYISNTKRRIKPSGVARSRSVHPGDFLLTNSMSFGHPYILQTSGCIHDGWLVLSPKNGNVHPDYFYHLLGSDEIYSEFSRLAAGATVKNLNIELVSGVKIRFPALPEQRRIAAILDQADALRAKRRAALAQLDEIASAIFLDMFGDPISNQRRYPVTRLGALVDQTRGISYGIVQRGPDQDEGVCVVRISDITKGVVDSTCLKRTTPEISARYRRTRLCGGELVISIRGTVGLVALVPASIVGANVSRELAVIPLKEEMSRPFVRDLMRTDAAQKRITADVRGIAQSGINLEDLRELPIIQPSEDLMAEYARRVNELDQLALKLKASMEMLDSLFASLQHRAFRGEL
jgi:type I restriction enzyme, S subunit